METVMENMMILLKVGFAVSPIIIIVLVLVFAREDEEEEKAKKELGDKLKGCKT